MNRRELLRMLAAAGAVPLLGGLSPRELIAVARVLEERGLRAGTFLTLTPHEGATVTAIAEAIIPETDTAGATTAGVPQFIDLIVGEWYTDAERAAFRAGLREVDARTRQAHRSNFIHASPAAQRQVLEAMEAEAILLRRSGARPQPFFATMKWLTLWGYYTSREGAVQELAYETIPGQYNGCVPVVPRERR
jgi:gluconate 2-dehydrogenase gamma chain